MSPQGDHQSRSRYETVPNHAPLRVEGVGWGEGVGVSGRGVRVVVGGAVAVAGAGVPVAGSGVAVAGTGVAVGNKPVSVSESLHPTAANRAAPKTRVAVRQVARVRTGHLAFVRIIPRRTM